MPLPLPSSPSVHWQLIQHRPRHPPLQRRQRSRPQRLKAAEKSAQAELKAIAKANKKQRLASGEAAKPTKRAKLAKSWHSSSSVAAPAEEFTLRGHMDLSHFEGGPPLHAGPCC